MWCPPRFPDGAPTASSDRNHRHQEGELRGFAVRTFADLSTAWYGRVAGDSGQRVRTDVGLRALVLGNAQNPLALWRIRGTLGNATQRLGRHSPCVGQSQRAARSLRAMSSGDGAEAGARNTARYSPGSISMRLSGS